MADRMDSNARGTLPSWDRVEGNWKQLTGKLRERWGELTDDDLARINGRRDQLVGKIQERYGIIQDQAERQVADWHSEMSKSSRH